MTKLNTISTTTLLALAKAIESEVKDRDTTLPGSYSVDETLTMKVSGTVTKCEDETYIPTIKIAHKAAMALLIRNCGITGQAAVNALETAMRASLEADEKSESYITAMADLEAAEAKLKASLDKLPKATRTGKTLIKVKVD